MRFFRARAIWYSYEGHLHSLGLFFRLNAFSSSSLQRGYIYIFIQYLYFKSSAQALWFFFVFFVVEKESFVPSSGVFFIFLFLFRSIQSNTIWSGQWCRIDVKGDAAAGYSLTSCVCLCVCMCGVIHCSLAVSWYTWQVDNGRLINPALCKFQYKCIQALRLNEDRLTHPSQKCQRLNVSRYFWIWAEAGGIEKVPSDANYTSDWGFYIWIKISMCEM